MTGLATYAATKRSIVGVDWMNMASGALKTAGGAFGASGGGGDTAAAEAKARLEAEKRAAEQSASNWKMIGIAGVVVILGALILRKTAA